MTIRGKSALRKKRLKRVPRSFGRRVAAGCPATRTPLRVGEFRAKDPYIRQVAVSLGKVKAVADHEPVRDLEADVAAVHLVLPSLRLGEEGADLERGRLARLQHPQHVGQRQARVDDVLDDADVAPLDGAVEVLEDPDDAGG